MIGFVVIKGDEDEVRISAGCRGLDGKNSYCSTTCC